MSAVKLKYALTQSLIISLFLIIDLPGLSAENDNSDYKKLLNEYNSGIRLFNSKLFGEAAEKFKWVLLNDSDSSFPETFENLINSYLLHAQNFSRKKFFKQSLDVYSEILKLDKDNQIAKYNSGVILSNFGNEEFSKKNYFKAIEFFLASKEFLEDSVVDDNISSAYYNAAAVEKDFNKSIELYRKSLVFNANNINAYFNLGVLFFNENSFDESEKWFEEIFKIENNTNDNSIVKSKALYFLSRIKEAKGDFSGALKLAGESVKSGLSDENYLKSAERMIADFKPRRYKLVYNFNIFNNSNSGISDVVIKINVPKSEKNKQKVHSIKEYFNKEKKYSKEFSQDANENKILIFKFGEFKEFETLNIIIESEITAYPNFYNLEKFKIKSAIPAKSSFIKDIFKVKDYSNALRAAYDFVINALEYKIIDADLDINKILFFKKGKCVEYVTLFNYILNEIGFKTRSVSGEVIEYGNERVYGFDAGHNWSEVFIEEEGWVPFDPTFEDTGKKNYFAVGRSDRVITSIGKSNLIDIKYKIEYLASAKPTVDLQVKTEKKLSPAD